MIKRTLSLVVIAVVVLTLSAVAASATGKVEKESKKTAKAEKLVEVVNPRCPLMGTPMDKTVPENMTRMYKGQRIGFCCDKCLKNWDTMNDADRDAKLKEALKPVKTEKKKK